MRNFKRADYNTGRIAVVKTWHGPKWALQQAYTEWGFFLPSKTPAVGVDLNARAIQPQTGR
jgi:hypothetical protein